MISRTYPTQCISMRVTVFTEPTGTITSERRWAMVVSTYLLRMQNGYSTSQVWVLWWTFIPRVGMYRRESVGRNRVIAEGRWESALFYSQIPGNLWLPWQNLASFIIAVLNTKVMVWILRKAELSQDPFVAIWLLRVTLIVLISFAFDCRNKINSFCHPPRYSGDPRIVASTGKLDERECRARFHSRPGKSREEAHGEWVCSISGGNLVNRRKQERFVVFGGGFPAAKHNILSSFGRYCPTSWNAHMENCVAILM